MFFIRTFCWIAIFILHSYASMESCDTQDDHAFEFNVKKIYLHYKGEDESAWLPFETTSFQKPCAIFSINSVSRLFLSCALMVMCHVGSVLSSTICLTEVPDLNTNITANIRSLLCYQKYNMALGCPEIQEQKGYTLPNKIVISWLPCNDVSTQKEEACARIKPTIISYYNHLIYSERYERGYNMGFTYSRLKSQGKLRCLMEEAPDWMSLNFERLSLLVKMLGHNINTLKSSAYPYLAQFQLQEPYIRIGEYVHELIDALENPEDRKKLYLTFNRYSRGTNKLRDLTYLRNKTADYSSTPLGSLYIWNIKRDGIIAFAHAIRQGFIVERLSLQEIDDKGASAIGLALEKPSFIKELIFFDGQITSVGASALAKMLIVNKDITLLRLRNNPIKTEAMSEFADVLTRNTVLQTLALTSLKMGNEGAVKLARGLAKNKYLRSLDLSENLIGSEGILALVEAFVHNDHLKWLDLSQNKIDEEAIISISSLLLTKNKTESTLCLDTTLMKERGAVAMLNMLKKNIYVTVRLSFSLIPNSLRKELDEVLRWKNRTHAIEDTSLLTFIS